MNGDNSINLSVRPNSGTCLFAVSQCTETKTGSDNWIEPEQGDNLPPWIMFGRFTQNESMWHVLAVETNTGTTERGISWRPRDADADNEKSRQCKYVSQNSNQLNGSTDYNLICPECGQAIHISLTWQSISATDHITDFDLVVDLGTSRTSAVLVNQSTDPVEGGPSGRIVPLCFWPEGLSGDFEGENNKDKRKDYTVVPSICFLHPNAFESIGNGSFVRQLLHDYEPKGEAARRIPMRPVMFLRASPLLLRAHSKDKKELWSTWNKIASHQGLLSTTRFLQAAPKRYLGHDQIEDWCNAPDKTLAAVIARLMHSNGSEYDWRQGSVEEIFLPTLPSGQSWKSPRSDALIWYCLSILEQAWEQINTEWVRTHYYGITTKAVTGERRLREIVVTVPPGWPPRAKKRLITAWERAIALFRQLNPCTIQAGREYPYLSDTRLDEAFSAQFPFVAVLFEGAGARHVHKLASILSTTNDDSAFRVMTIDIGGGTTDLSVCEYRHDSKKDVVNVNPGFCHSSAIAGDTVMYALLEQLLLPAVIDSLETDDTVKNQVRALFTSHARLDPGQNIQFRHEAYLVFAPLARLLLEEMVNRPDDDNVEVSFTHTDSRKELTYLTELLKIVKAPEVLPESVTVSSRKAINIIANELAPVLNVAGKHLASEKADLVMLSGKLTEISRLADRIASSLPILPGRVLKSYDAQVPTYFPNIWRTIENRLADSKCLVATGAALMHMLQRPIPGVAPGVVVGAALGFTFNLQNQTNYEWGFYNTVDNTFSLLFDATKEVFPNVKLTVDVNQEVGLRQFKWQNQSCLLGRDTHRTWWAMIGRRVPGAMHAEAMYRLIIDDQCASVELQVEHTEMGEDINLQSFQRIVPDNDDAPAHEPHQEDAARLTLDMIGKDEHGLEGMIFPRLRH